MQSIVTDFKNRQCNEVIKLLDAASWGRLATYAVQLHVNYCQFYARAVRTIAEKTAWRFLFKLPSFLYRVCGRCWATPIEQAAFNVARQLGEGFIPISAIITRARRVVSEATQFYLKADKRLLFGLPVESLYVFYRRRS